MIKPEGGNPYTINLDKTGFFDLEVKRFRKYHFSIPVDSPPEKLELEYRMFHDEDLLHRGLLAIGYNVHTDTDHKEFLVPLLFSPRSPTETLDLPRVFIYDATLGLQAVRESLLLGVQIPAAPDKWSLTWNSPTLGDRYPFLEQSARWNAR